jgi:hypothetical protein
MGAEDGMGASSTRGVSVKSAGALSSSPPPWARRTTTAWAPVERLGTVPEMLPSLQTEMDAAVEPKSTCVAAPP